MIQFIKVLGFTFLVFINTNFQSYAKSNVQVKNLICEYHDNPIGIDIQKPRLSWQIFSDKKNAFQSAYEIQVRDGSETGNVLWNSGKVNTDQSVNITYLGPILNSMQRVYWKVRIWDQKGEVSSWSESAFWEMGLLNPTEWKAYWITDPNDKGNVDVRPCPYLRKEFAATKKVKSARVYVTSLGLYQLYFNGEKVSSDLFTPGWTSYNKRLQYQTYDVTEQIQSKNTIAAILSDGWYRGRIGFTNVSNYYGNQIALLLQLQINYTDGTSEIITSDDSWKTSTGPILASSIFDGEIYDARMEMTDWNQPDFNDDNWRFVEMIEHPKNILVAPQGVAVKEIEELKPIQILKTPKGETVYDLGQNMVGWVRLKVKGDKGDTVNLKFAEILDRDGNFYTTNLRTAKATDTYILKGNGEEIYEPFFTFHGFRYVKIEGFPGTPTLDNITGIVVHSEMKQTGTFMCSDSLLNQLQHNIQWGQRDNFLDVPTDCPQRDERCGWTGDAQVFSMTAAFNYDVSAFYTKWLKDLSADQNPDGRIPHVIPDMLNGEGGSTAWADAATVIPWNVYLVYGDRRILEEQYSSMKAWVDYMDTRAGADHLWTENDHFGDWLAFDASYPYYTGANTEKDLIATAYFSYSSGILAKSAKIIGKDDDAQKYEKLSNDIKRVFEKEFLTANGRMVSHTQTAYSLALVFNLLPEDLIPKAASYLAEDVKKFGHLTTGFVGTPLLCKALSDNGYSDLAFMLLKRKKYPSWLYPVTQGATTIWERWDGQKPDGSFQDAGMNSFNHYAYGAIGEWLYTYVAGINIDPENPGYKHIILTPHVGGELTNASAEFNSMYGKIKSDWNIQGDTFEYIVTIPANTTATIILPHVKPEDVLINSEVLIEKTNINIQESSNNLEFKLGSGNYTLKSPNFKN